MFENETAEGEVPSGEVRQAALSFLARREHSRVELRQKLVRKFGRSPVIDPVLADLEENGYLSDRRFAASVTRTRTGRGYGPLKVRAELSAKGVKGDAAEQAIESQQTDWVDVARQAIRKRFGVVAASDRDTRAKCYRFLAQRGFSAEQIRQALEVNPSED